MLYDITYTIHAEDRNEAIKMAYENIYVADIDVEEVVVRARRQASDPYMTYGAVPTESENEIFRRLHEKGFGDV